MSNILLVDDEKLILASFEKFLTKEGYTVFSCVSATEALETLKKESIDLALLDVLMPEVSGIDLAKQIRKNAKTKDLDIIFITVMAKAGEDVRKAIAEIKPIEWVQKPVDVAHLRAVVKKALGRKK